MEYAGISFSRYLLDLFSEVARFKTAIQSLQSFLRSSCENNFLLKMLKTQTHSFRE